MHDQMLWYKFNREQTDVQVSFKLTYNVIVFVMNVVCVRKCVAPNCLLL